MLISSWIDSKAFKSLTNKMTQTVYYEKMGASEEVLQLVKLNSKPFGAVGEKILREFFNIDPGTSTQNDGVRHKKIEIKCARYWGGTDDCRWQHLEPNYDYEIALFALLDFHGWKVWGIKKSILMGELREKKIVTFQGKQGFWVKKSSILPYLTPINNIEELDFFINAE